MSADIVISSMISHNVEVIVEFLIIESFYFFNLEMLSDLRESILLVAKHFKNTEAKKVISRESI